MHLYTLLLSTVRFILGAYGYVLMAAAIASWVPDLASTPMGMVLQRITDPYLKLFSRLIPALQIGGVTIQLSTLVGLIVYFILQQTVFNVLSTLLLRSGLG